MALAGSKDRDVGSFESGCTSVEVGTDLCVALSADGLGSLGNHAVVIVTMDST